MESAMSRSRPAKVVQLMYAVCMLASATIAVYMSVSTWQTFYVTDMFTIVFDVNVAVFFCLFALLPYVLDRGNYLWFVGIVGFVSLGLATQFLWPR